MTSGKVDDGFSKPSMKCSKSSPSTRRRARNRDRDFLMRSRVFGHSKDTATDSASLDAHHPSPSFTPTPPIPLRGTAPPTHIERLLSKYKRTRTPPRWDEATALSKAVFFHREVAKRLGVSFTLNLSPEVEKSARADPRSFTEHIRRRLQRALKAAFNRSVDFWFGIDVSAEGRPHLHGGVAVLIDEQASLLRSLTQAGGKWASAHGVGHQAHIGQRLDDEWAAYAVKTIGPSRREEYGCMISVTDNIRRQAKRAFDSEREYVLTYIRNRTKISHH